jgi:hypothetical protein
MEKKETNELLHRMLLYLYLFKQLSLLPTPPLIHHLYKQQSFFQTPSVSAMSTVGLLTRLSLETMNKTTRNPPHHVKVDIAYNACLCNKLDCKFPFCKFLSYPEENLLHTLTFEDTFLLAREIQNFIALSKNQEDEFFEKHLHFHQHQESRTKMSGSNTPDGLSVLLQNEIWNQHKWVTTDNIVRLTNNQIQEVFNFLVQSLGEATFNQFKAFFSITNKDWHIHC